MAYVPQAHVPPFPYPVKEVVLMGRALAQEAPVLVMDEPTASLDFGNQARVLARIADLAQTGGHAVILSTHDPDQAFALNARVILMHEGGILAQGSPGQVLTAQRLSQVYGVDVAVETTGSGRHVCAPSLRQPELKRNVP